MHMLCYAMLCYAMLCYVRETYEDGQSGRICSATGVWIPVDDVTRQI